MEEKATAQRRSRHVRALVRPPRLSTGENREANRLELFFDLAYVMVLAELATAFGKDLTWTGLGEFLGLFVMIWFSWLGFTLYANRFDTDDVVFRLAKIAATLAIAGCAASASKATGELSAEFTMAYLLGRALLLALYLRSWIHVGEARRTVGVYMFGATVTCTLLAVSLAIDTTQRPWWWAAAIAVDALTPLLASRIRGGTAPVHMEHLPERLGLFVILVLGEGVLGAVTAVSDSKWQQPSVLGGIAAFLVMAGLWWCYFDAGAEQSAEALEAHEQDRGREGEAHDPGRRHDVYVYAHLPFTAGIALAAVGLKDLALHPAQPPGADAWLVAAGLMTSFAGLMALMLGAGIPKRRAWWPAVGVAVSLVVITVDDALWSATAAAVVCVGVASLATWSTTRRTANFPDSQTAPE